ncbi:hypothetical protein BJ742DRAFT_104881 [Cladochytrium replicatum]|nr:hypothetical protein BJ742DRAFT_104881 [Cladochytrium replicatum]
MSAVDGKARGGRSAKGASVRARESIPKVEHLDLEELVERIVTRGLLKLDEANLKCIKEACKKNPVDNVLATHDFVWSHLQKRHAQIRYSCVQLIDELFSRSHLFREKCLEKFPEFLQCTLGIQDHPLPPPRAWAEKLLQLTLGIIKEWHTKFGEAYQQLDVGVKFLKETLGVSLEHDDIHFPTPAAQRARELRSKAFKTERYKILMAELDQLEHDIIENLNRMNQCFSILVPSFEDMLPVSTITNHASSENVTLRDVIQTHGLGSTSYKLIINVPTSTEPTSVTETPENTVIFQTLRECVKVLTTKHAVKIGEALDAIIRADDEDKASMSANLRKVSDLKQSIASAREKAAELGVRPDQATRGVLDLPDDSDSYSDEEFEEVETHGGSGPDLLNPVDPYVPNDKVNASSAGLSEDKGKTPVAGRSSKGNVEPSGTKAGLNASDIPPNVVTGKLGNVFDSRVVGSSTRKVPLQPQHETPEKEVTELPSVEQTSNNEEFNRLLGIAPVVEYGQDLYYWDKNDIQFNTSGFEISHFFGIGSGDAPVPEHILENLRKRSVYVGSDTKPSNRMCRAPLKSGKLCPRRDTEVCPYHGKIIPRDDLGNPIQKHTEGGFIPQNASSSSSSSSSSTNQPPPVWQQIAEDVNQEFGLTAGQDQSVNGTIGFDKYGETALIDIKKKKLSAKEAISKKLKQLERKRKQEGEDDGAREREMKRRDRKLFSW